MAVIEAPAAKAANPVLDHAPAVTVVVPKLVAPENTVIVVPLTAELVPLTVVAPTQIGDVTVGVAVVATTTALEVALRHKPEVCAVAVIDSPAVKAARPVFVHALLVTVVVPKLVTPEYTVIVVPLAAVTVPLTDVAPTHIGEVTVGVAVFTGCALIVTVPVAQELKPEASSTVKV